MSIGELGLLIHDSGKAKVSNFDIFISVQENIARFQVTVKYFLIKRTLAIIDSTVSTLVILMIIESTSMTVRKTKRYLCQEFPNDVLSYVILGLPSLSDNLLEISTLAVLHDDVNLSIRFVNDAIIVLDDVRMVQFSQNVDL